MKRQKGMILVFSLIIHTVILALLLGNMRNHLLNNQLLTLAKLHEQQRYHAEAINHEIQNKLQTQQTLACMSSSDAGFLGLYSPSKGERWCQVDKQYGVRYAYRVIDGGPQCCAAISSNSIGHFFYIAVRMLHAHGEQHLITTLVTTQPKLKSCFCDPPFVISAGQKSHYWRKHE